MNFTPTPDPYHHMPVSSQQTFPIAPYPRKYLHSVLYDLGRVVQAVQILRASGYNEIHVMASWDFVEATEREYRYRNPFSKALKNALLFLDEGFGNIYLQEALQGRHILAIRLSQYEQVKQACTILASHAACRMKYVDTWTVADL